MVLFGLFDGSPLYPSQWLFGYSGNGVTALCVSMKLLYVEPRWYWVGATVRGLGICNQPRRPTELPILSQMGNQYRSKGGGSAGCSL